MGIIKSIERAYTDELELVFENGNVMRKSNFIDMRESLNKNL